MTAPDPLPGTIEGLILKCSPVLHMGLRFVVCADEPNEDGLWPLGNGNVYAAPEAMALLLDEPTGRCHAAWYCFKRGPEHVLGPDYLVLYEAACNRPCDVERLRELVVMVAERVKRKALEVTT